MIKHQKMKFWHVSICVRFGVYLCLREWTLQRPHVVFYGPPIWQICYRLLAHKQYVIKNKSDNGIRI